MIRPTIDVAIRPLAAVDLPGFITAAQGRYADQKHTVGAIPVEEAHRQARIETAVMFPDGRLRDGHVVLQASEPGGAPCGWVWVGPHRVEEGLTFVYDIVVDGRARGHGNGTQLLDAAHGWARSNGYSSVSLHVFAGNEAAITLYRSHGYQTTDLLMRRSLT